MNHNARASYLLAVVAILVAWTLLWDVATAKNTPRVAQAAEPPREPATAEEVFRTFEKRVQEAKSVFQGVEYRLVDGKLKGQKERTLPKQEALTAEQLFRKLEKQVQDARFVFIGYVGERTIKKGQETTRSYYAGTYHAKGDAEAGGLLAMDTINQDEPIVGQFARGGKVKGGIKDPAFAKVPDYFWHGPVTRTGCFREALQDPYMLLLPPVSDFEFADPKAGTDAAGSKGITYALRLEKNRAYAVTLWLDEKSLTPRQRVVRWSASGEDVEVRERYHGFSTKQSPAAYQGKALPVIVASGRLSAKVGQDWVPTGWISEGVSYRALEQTRLLLPSGGRATLATAGECKFNKDKRGHELQLTRGQVSVEFPFRDFDPITLVLGQVRLTNVREIAGRSVLTATPDRVVVEQGAASVEGVPLEPSSKVTEGRKVHHLLPEGVEYRLHGLRAKLGFMAAVLGGWLILGMVLLSRAARPM